MKLRQIPGMFSGVTPDCFVPAGSYQHIPRKKRADKLSAHPEIENMTRMAKNFVGPLMQSNWVGVNFNGFSMVANSRDFTRISELCQGEYFR